jgi:hypothetical protein
VKEKSVSLLYGQTVRLDLGNAQGRTFSSGKTFAAGTGRPGWKSANRPGISCDWYTKSG